MDASEATALLRDAIPEGGGTWAELGAGDGTFTRALVGLIGRERRVYAVDRDARAIARLLRWAESEAPGVVPVLADFTRDFELPGLDPAGLDGWLLANSLHFARDAATVLANLAARLRPGGRVVLIEYDRRDANPWVPHPVPLDRLPGLLERAGLSPPVVTATRPSAFGGHLYVAISVARGTE